MSTRIRAWLVFTLGAALTIATSTAYYVTSDSVILDSIPLTREQPYHAISGFVETSSVDIRNTTYLSLNLSLRIVSESETSGTLTLFKLNNAWQSGDPLPSDDFLVGGEFLSNVIEAENGYLYVTLDSPNEDFHLLLVWEGDPVALRGELAASINMDTEFADDAEIRLVVQP